ncbi:hypothetical protein, partial [Desulforhabdus sp. TSK]|uniref:hypothetical protein n=1 Tax=Desulforhabdus sp. TSK TaxID=2925014 RepID=UPI001FC80B5A
MVLQNLKDGKTELAEVPCPGPMTGPWRFCFLNEEKTLRASTDWNHPGWDRLWLYNLHYFDDL